MDRERAYVKARVWRAIEREDIAAGEVWPDEDLMAWANQVLRRPDIGAEYGPDPDGFK